LKTSPKNTNHKKESEMLQLHRRSIVSGTEKSKLRSAGISLASNIAAEWCFYIGVSATLTDSEMNVLRWLLGETFDPSGLSVTTFLSDCQTVLEIGPRLNFETPWSSTARQVCHQVGLHKVVRLERARRFGFGQSFTLTEQEALLASTHDRMTEVPYLEPLKSFETGLSVNLVHVVPVIRQGIDALRTANTKFGLAMDEQDLMNYYKLFARRLNRDPTDVELFQLGQGNSEHSRHGFFGGTLWIDGQPVDTNLMSIVKAPWRANPNNSVIAFHDDSSAIRGGTSTTLVSVRPGFAGSLVLESRTYHPTLTAETHNFPTGIAPYPGAATGTGGRIRDNQCVGRGGLVVASGVGYCAGNLHIPGYDLPWENDEHRHPSNLASPLEILIQGSNGASDYGNCFGEPLVLGHARTFGLGTPDGYRSWYKPILYTEGVGQLDFRHVDKGAPEVGMLVVQIGGPAYRIGMGGGAASSLMSGDNAAHLDFNAVQRGAPEMEQRVNRVIRACVELGDENPIVSAHDLGAGGDSNALPEIVNPVGGRIDLRAIPAGDASLSVLEIWGNESQERNALLIWPADLGRFSLICERENAPCAVVGEITGDGQLVVFDSADNTTPVDMPLAPILGDIPPKTIELQSVPIVLEPLHLPEGLTVEMALERVLRLVSVGSKRWLTNKVDRSVTGLVAQQQCVGPFHTPLSNYAVVAHSLFGSSGTAFSQGEKPLMGLISPAAQGRMSVGEALTNLMGAKITALEDIRCSANWMWAAKLPGEGARLHEAAMAMSSLMISLGMAIDGGKDSLSMASKDESGTVKAPGQLVIAPYAVMPDVTAKVTPEFKAAGNQLLLIDLGGGKTRLGGSALAQAYQQLGNDCPDVDDVDLLKRAFDGIQALIEQRLIASLHDRSDGGLAVSLIEMAIAGNFGATIEVSSSGDPLHALFSEELGVILEVSPDDLTEVTNRLGACSVAYQTIGRVGSENGDVIIACNHATVLNRPLHLLRGAWEETSSRLDEQQASPDCARAEFSSLSGSLKAPDWQLSFRPHATQTTTEKPMVAVLREAGTNGDREMAAALIEAGFDVWDVTMRDLFDETVELSQFRGVVFPGGFSFGDVLDSGKGWAGVIRFNPILTEQFEAFYERPDTFSLGVCNGAQLMALLGWVPFKHLTDPEKPRFIHNRSGRFESRLSTVEVFPSPAIMLDGMAGSRLGVWVAHGEGRLQVPEPKLLTSITRQGLAPLRFIDADNQATTRYPFNPNGSPEGITALCSPDGRHLAMMPHPERLSNQLWQWPWLPKTWTNLEASPWLRMFQNAHTWCAKT
jgi:phosphoribosylformylglycinamidine synthase